MPITKHRRAVIDAQRELIFRAEVLWSVKRSGFRWPPEVEQVPELAEQRLMEAVETLWNLRTKPRKEREK